MKARPRALRSASRKAARRSSSSVTIPAKDAIRSGAMYGAITQNPLGIGKCTVEEAVKALKGEKLPKVVDTGFYYYDKTNIDDPKIAAVLYD